MDTCDIGQLLMTLTPLSSYEATQCRGSGKTLSAAACLPSSHRQPGQRLERLDPAHVAREALQLDLLEVELQAVHGGLLIRLKSLPWLSASSLLWLTTIMLPVPEPQ